MVRSYANKITECLIENKKIKNDDYQLYLYALEALISSIANIAIILLIGALFNRFIETFLFLLFYCPIRQFGGGFHTENYRRCLLFFITVYISNIFLIDKLISLKVTTPIVLATFISFIGIIFMVPQEHRNNPLSKAERKKYRKIVMYITSFLLLISIVGINLSITYEYGVYLSSVLIWNFIMLILGIIKKEVKNL